ncbi:MAG: hypothetical protein JXA28_05645 [Bacteroidetes bacterium]|nr:hypothetical protein [Bacteroidota bacterium]
MLVILNTKAHAGTAGDRWKRIETVLRKRIDESMDIVTMDPSAEEQLRQQVARGERHIVAAGGDGTVNAVLQMIMTLPHELRTSVYLGAIGLGSSNDMHKPHRPDEWIDNVPVRLDFPHASRRDVGMLTCRIDGATRVRYWLLNASAGVTADANAFFNSGDAFLRLLKRHATALAILYAAFHGIVTTGARTVYLSDGEDIFRRCRLNNLAVLISPHVSGSLTYDVPVSPAGGQFVIHLLSESGRMQVLALLIALLHGGSSTLRRASMWVGCHLRIRGTEPFPVEYDGEVLLTDDALFGLHPDCIWVAS